MKDDGGNAFPLSRENEGWFEKGMTLRDWFAGQAMPRSMDLVLDNTQPEEVPKSGATAHVAQLAAQIAYVFADAMLKERDK